MQSSPNFCFKDGNLILQITKDQQHWCPEFDGEVRCSAIQTGEFAGPVGSKLGQRRFSSACVVREAQGNIRTYTPQYGYFELRAKGVNTSANHAALWMIGYEDSPENSGEIAIFEPVGSQAGRTSSGVRFGVHPFEGAWTGGYDPSTPSPKRSTINYFRAYQPVGGYVR
ncbi:MAG TPA: hypothetical protein VMN99_11870 [Anaerolineales bacterium]|nr:hypothetical protein [Anaerolineales bacterium]